MVVDFKKIQNELDKQIETNYMNINTLKENNRLNRFKREITCAFNKDATHYCFTNGAFNEAGKVGFIVAIQCEREDTDEIQKFIKELELEIIDWQIYWDLSKSLNSDGEVAYDCPQCGELICIAYDVLDKKCDCGTTVVNTYHPENVKKNVIIP